MAFAAYSGLAGPGARRMLKRILSKDNSGVLLKKHTLFYKAGVPTDAADYANADGDLCVDTTNNDLYMASAVTRGSAVTWTKVVG